MRKGGLNCPNFDVTVKALRLSWISRLLEKKLSSDAWKATCIPNAFFEKYGALNFLLKCSYNTKKLDKSVSLSYLEKLDYFKELLQVNQDGYKSDLILWNNQDITIEGKLLFWKRWPKNGIYYIQDILNENGKFLTFKEFNQRYNMSAGLKGGKGPWWSALGPPGVLRKCQEMPTVSKALPPSRLSHVLVITPVMQLYCSRATTAKGGYPAPFK